MYLLNNYYENIIRHDSLNKFNHSNLLNLPKLEKIVLSFGFKKYNFKTLLSALLALELITAQKPAITKSKLSNITLQIRKGDPIGCKITLRKKMMLYFLFKILNELLPKTRKLPVNFKSKTKVHYAFKIENILAFGKLENNYKFFKNLKGLNICFVTNCSVNNYLKFLLKSYKII